MAKKESEDYDLDNFDLDDFGSDDPMMDPFDTKDDRKPSVKITSGAIDGIKESATSPGYYGKIMKKALPTAYGEAFDVIDTVGSESVGLYNEAVQELKPALRGIKRAVRTIKPKLEPALPKWLSKKIDDLTADEGVSAQQAAVDANEAAINSSLLEIFKQQAEKGAETEAKDEVREVIATKRAKANTDQIESIRSYMQRLVAYQDGITANYQKKSLELQYRQFFATRDLLEVTKGSSTEALTLLQNVVKNTALPDFVKLNNDEAFKEQVRNKLVGQVHDFVSGGIGDFTRDLMKNLRTRSMEKVKDFSEQVIGAAQGAEDLQNASDMMDDMGMDKSVAAGNMVGGGIMDWAAGKLGKFANKYLMKNDKVAGSGLALKRGINTGPDMLREWARRGNMQYGWKGDVLDFIQSLIPQENKSINLAESKIGDLAAQAYWSGADSRSLQVIIPGLLSRIHQSSEGVRTGQEAPLLTYDHTKSDFVTMSAMKTTIGKKVVNKDMMSDLTYRTDEILEQLDPNNKLSPKVRDALRVKLLSDSAKKGSFSINDYNTEDAYAGTLNPEDSEQVANLFRDLISTDENGKTALSDIRSQKNYTKLASSYSYLRQNHAESAQAAMNAVMGGHTGLLRELGISKYKGGKDTFNENYILDQYMNYLNTGQSYEKSSLETSSNSPVVRATPAIGYRLGGAMGGANPIVPPSTDGPSSDPESLSPSAKEEIRRKWDEVLGSRGRGQPRGRSERFESQLGRQEAFSDASLETLGDLFAEHSSRPFAERSADKLDEIFELLLSSDFGLGNGDRGSIARRLGSGIGRFAKGAKTGFTKGFKSIGGMIGKVYSAPLKLAKKAWELSAKGFGMMRDRVQDVYVSGMKEVAMTKAKIKEGHYQDVNTGNIIEKLSDITGSVRDITTDTIVIDAGQFDLGLFDAKWKKIKTTSRGFIADKATKALKLGKDIITAPLRAQRAAMNFIKETFFVPDDVYLPGETSPKLLGIKLLRGQYKSSATGKPITSLEKIDSDVLDENGNVVLQLEDIKRGLVDKNGKPIESLARKAKNLVFGAAGLAFKGAKLLATTAAGAVKGSFNLAKSGAGWMKDKAAGMFNGSGGFSIQAGLGLGGGQYQVEHLNVSKKIYNLLRNHFGVEGQDLEMTEVTGIAGGLGRQFRGAKLKAKRLARRAKASKRLKRINSASAREELKDELFSKARKKTRNAKAKALRKQRKTSRGYRSWKEKQTEKFATIRKNGWRETLAARAKETKDSVHGRMAERVKNDDGIVGKILTAVMGIGGFLSSGLSSIIGGIGSMRKILTAISLGKAATDVVGGVDLPDGGDGKSSKGGKGGKGRGIGSKVWGAAKWLGKGALKLGGAALALGGWGASAAGTAISAVGAAVSAPVVLTAAAVAAVAVGGYYAYKYFKDGLKPLQRVRFSQYGLDLDDRDLHVKVGEVEAMLYPNIIWEQGKPVNIKTSSTLENALKIFGIDLSLSDDVQQFADWFQNRFKPVYLTHIAMMSKYGNGHKLESIDSSLGDENKVEFAKATLYPLDSGSTPYNVTSHPIRGRSLVRGTHEISSTIQEVVDEFGNAKAKGDKTKASKGSGASDETRDRRAKEHARLRAKFEARKEASMQKHYERESANLPSLHERESVRLQQSGRGVYGHNQAGTGVLANLPNAGSQNHRSYLGDPTKGGSGIYREMRAAVAEGDNLTESIIERAADATGMDAAVLMGIAQAESSMNPKAMAKTSSASGLFQFTKRTWRNALAKFGDKYGIPKDASPFDAVAASLLAGELTRDNARIVESITGKRVGPGEAYIAHFMGAPQGAKLLGSDPSLIAAELFAREAKANPSIFYKSGGQARTIAEVRTKLSDKVSMPVMYDQGTAIASVLPGDETSLANKSPTAAAPKFKAIDALGRREKLNLGLGRSVGTVGNDIKSNQRLITTMNQTEVEEANRRPLKAQPAMITSKPVASEQTSRQEKQRMERLIQSAGQTESLVKTTSNMVDILSKSLEVQLSMDESLRTVADGITKLLSGDQKKVTPSRPRQANPVNLSRKQYV